MLLTTAEKVASIRRRERKKSLEMAATSELETAGILERMGRTLALVTRLIREDAETSGSPLVLSQDRQTAVELLVVLLSDKSERATYGKFLETALPTIRHSDLPDSFTVNYVLERRWSQLSSGFLGQLLLNSAALRKLSDKLASDRPTAWSDVLPAVKQPSATKPAKAARSSRR